MSVDSSPSKNEANGFEAVIGLEVHCQLSTESKIFCSCRARLQGEQTVADVAVNANTCPVCAGHPGTLPVLNRKAVDYAIRAGLATHCKILNTSVFSRKNYFYPDLPKGYQISQFDLPICLEGWLEIDAPQGSRRIQIQRIHLEEDAGKNVHLPDCSLVNLNRAGVPLIEIVSGPDLRSASEAGAYLRSLYAIVTYLGICDGNLQEGNFRCDANVSVRPRGSDRFGTRAEIKNVNSFRFVEKAIEYEISRQISVIQQGGKVVQETRTYDSARNVTISMRSKEEAQDYRYFPEPDLMPLLVSDAWIEKVRASLPELPDQKRARYIQQMSLSPYDAGVLTQSKSLAEFFEQALAASPAAHATKDTPKQLANLLTGEVARLLNEKAIELKESRLTPQNLSALVGLIQKGVLSSTAAKQVLQLMWETGDAAQAIVDREGLAQVSDASSLEPIIDQVIAAHPAQAADYRGGKEKLLGFFVGQAMKEMKGKGNPSLIQDLMKKRLEK